mgnify:CR=1 FL=1
MDTFKYNIDRPREENFQNWHVMNSEERSTYKLPEYSRERAREVFDNILESKLAHSIKINSDGILEDVLVVEW